MTNRFLRFAENAQATNTLTDAEYSGDAIRSEGHVTGTASSRHINKTLQNVSAITSAVGAFIDAFHGIPGTQDANDLMSTDELADAFVTALRNRAPTLATSGTGAVYTISSNLVPTPIPEGYRFRVRFHAENTAGSATLNINGSGALNITSVDAAVLGVGAIRATSIHDVERVGGRYVLVSGGLPFATELVSGIAAFSSQVQAEAATNNASVLTPLRGLQLLRAPAASASTTQRGAVRINAGGGLNLTDGVLSLDFQRDLSQLNRGFYVLPGGFMVQWASVPMSGTQYADLLWPRPFSQQQSYGFVISGSQAKPMLGGVMNTGIQVMADLSTGQAGTCRGIGVGW